MIDAHAGGIGTVGIGGTPELNLGYVYRHLILHADLHQQSEIRAGVSGGPISPPWFRGFG